jgi:RNA-binding protein YlmH
MIKITDPSKELSPGDRISVRGCGRFYFDGEEKKTRSGRGRMKVRIFQ